MKHTHKKFLSSRRKRLAKLYDREFLDRCLSEIRRKTRGISPSETMSLYSDSPEWEFYLGGLKNLSAIEALALVVCFPKEDLLWWEVRERIMEDAYRYQYKGNWRLVQKLLNINDEKLQLRFFFEYHSSEELFGNLLPVAIKRISRLQIQKRYPKVKRPQRKRGYNDHGSRRDDSKWLPSDVHLGPNPEKSDLRRVAVNLKEKIRNFLWS